MSSDISFFSVDPTNIPLDGKDQKFVQWLLDVAQAENKTICKLTYIFCSDEYLLDINNKYLGHDFYTDIITFPYKEGHEIESDLFISVDRVRENAVEFNVTFDNELKRVMIHGLLHLMGYGDKSEDQISLMREKEEYYIAKFDLFYPA